MYACTSKYCWKHFSCPYLPIKHTQHTQDTGDSTVKDSCRPKGATLGLLACTGCKARRPEAQTRELIGNPELVP